MRTLYFAYGSNMSEGDMRARCRSSRSLGSACLDEHRLAFTRRSVVSGTGVADVVSDPHQQVWGVVYELDDKELDVLDRKEGHGWAYTRERKRVRLTVDGSPHDAILYTVLVKERSEVPPSPAYLNSLIAAAEHHAFPHDYLVMLKAIPVFA